MVQHTDKAVEREAACFLKCDWLAFLRYSGVGQKDSSCDHRAFGGFGREIVHVGARLRPCRDPSAERGLNVVPQPTRHQGAIEMHRCVPARDFHKTRGQKGQIGGGGIFHHFSVQNLLLPPSPPPSTFSEQPTRAKTIQRQACWLSKRAVWSGAAPVEAARRRASQHSRTATATLFTSPLDSDVSLSSVGWDAAPDALVDALEALGVLHRHEEFLSQVIEGLVGRQIQAVEAAKQGSNVSVAAGVCVSEDVRPISRKYTFTFFLNV